MKPNDVWLTREEDIREIVREGQVSGFLDINRPWFDLDPCAFEGRRTPLVQSSMHLTERWNGLVDDWFHNVFVNPPFSQLDKWCDKAIQELTSLRATCVAMIVPNGTLSRNCVQDLIYYGPRQMTSIYPMRKRRPFINPQTMQEMKQPPFGITVIFKAS
jgi:DNA N-6-adenine-methyltransferase (Dam)